MAEALTDEHVERLLGEIDWLRRLAGRLTADAASADDLVQDTLVAALGRGRSDPPRSRAWLARVVRRLAALRRRAAGRSAARERAASRAGPAPSAADVVERSVVGRAVYDAVLGLEEPYRTALLLRYAEGLSTAEVAARQEIRADAARQRISRGIAMVRARTVRALGGSESGLPALAAFARPIRAIRWTEALRLGAAWPAAGAAAIAAAVLLLAHAPDPSPEPLARARASLAPPARADAEGAEAAVLADARAPGRRRAPGRAPAAAGTIVARLAPDGVPLADAQVLDATPATDAALRERVRASWRALGVDAAAERWLALAGEEAVPRDPRAEAAGAPDPAPELQPAAERQAGVTDAAGSVTLAALPEHALVLRHPAAAPWLIPRAALAAGGTVEVTVAPRAELCIAVVDAATGAPGAGSFVRVDLDPLRHPDPARPRPLVDGLAWHGPSDARGRITVGGLPAGAWVWATPLGEHAGGPALARVPEPGQRAVPGTPERPLALAVRRVGDLRGRVVWEGGAPASDLAAWLEVLVDRSAAGARERFARIGPDGAFCFEDAAAGPARLAFGPDGGWMIGELVARSAAVEAGRVTDLGTLVLPAMGTIRGRVDATPHGTASAQLVLSLHRDGRRCAAAAADAAGAFELRAPRGDYALVVQQSSGFGSVEIARVPARSPDEGMVIEIGGRMGTVRARLPAGMPGSVPICVRARPSREAALDWSEAHTLSFQDLRAVEGTLCAPPLLEGTYDLEIALGDFGTAHLRDVAVPAGGAVDAGELVIDGATLEGRVLDATGAPAPDARVILLAPARDPWSRAAPARRERRADARGPLGAGGYRMRGLDARRWTVYALRDDGWASAVLTVDLAAGTTRRQDLVLHPPCGIEGRVTRGGAPVEGVELRWRYEDLHVPKLSTSAAPAALTGADGAYRFGPYVPGTYGVSVRNEPVQETTVELAPGRTARVDFELDLSSAEVELALAGEPVPPGWTVQVTALDPGGPWAGHAAHATRTGDTRVALPLFPCPMLVEAREPAPPSTALHRVVDGRKVEDGDRIAFHDGELVLPAPRAAADAPPRLVLRGWPEADLEALGVFPGPLPCRVEDGTLVYGGLPPRARLRLQSAPYALGPETLVETGDERVTHVAWPFRDG